MLSSLTPIILLSLKIVVMFKEEYFQSPVDSKKIFYRSALRETRKAVVICHGACEHSGRYHRLIKFLWERGYSVFAYDHRGHGRSEGKRVHVDCFSDYLSDLDQMLNLLRNLNYPRIHLFGHSMGGLITARYVQEQQPDIASLILSSPLCGLGETSKIKIVAANIIASIWPGFTFKSPVDETLLSHDESVGQEYSEDPMVFNMCTVKWGVELMKSFPILFKKADLIRVPLLLMVAGADKLTNPNASREFFKIIGSRDKRYYFFEDMYHEIFNEVENDKPFGCLADWLKTLDRDLCKELG